MTAILILMTGLIVETDTRILIPGMEDIILTLTRIMMIMIMIMIITMEDLGLTTMTDPTITTTGGIEEMITMGVIMVGVDMEGEVEMVIAEGEVVTAEGEGVVGMGEGDMADKPHMGKHKTRKYHAYVNKRRR